MEVKILNNLNPEDLERQIASYHSTGWRMEGDVVVACLGQIPNEYGLIENRVLYIQKMVRD